MDSQIEKTQNYYDGIAKGYKELYHKEQISKINLVKKYFPNSGIILDLGCGDGVLNQFISKTSQIQGISEGLGIVSKKNSFKAKLISTDLSLELLKLNTNKNKILTNAENLPFKNNSFDFIFAFTIIQDVPNVDLVIKEIKRVLKQDGILILSFIKVSKKAETIEREITKNFKLIETSQNQKFSEGLEIVSKKNFLKIEEDKDFIFVLKN